MAQLGLRHSPVTGVFAGSNPADSASLRPCSLVEERSPLTAVAWFRLPPRVPVYLKVWPVSPAHTTRGYEPRDKGGTPLWASNYSLFVQRLGRPADYGETSVRVTDGLPIL